MSLDMGAAQPSEMTFTVEKITPEIAAEYLEHNVLNRRIAPTCVARYAKAMRAGKWRLTHQGIAFDPLGVLRDGQQRLRAVVDSGCTVEMVVARNAPPELFDVVDTGKPRSGADTMGLLGATNRAAVASAIRVLKGYAVAQREVGMPLQHAIRTTKVENYELGPWYRTYPQIGDWVPSCHLIHRAAPCLASPSAIAATLFLASRIDLEKTHSFVNAVTSLSNLPEGSAPLLLVRRARSSYTGSDGMAHSVIVLARALRQWFTGARASRLIAPPMHEVPDLGWLPFPDYFEAN